MFSNAMIVTLSLKGTRYSSPLMMAAWMIVLIVSLFGEKVGSNATPSPGHWECRQGSGYQLTYCDFEDNICKFDQGIIRPGNVEWRKRHFDDILGMENNLNLKTPGLFLSVDSGNPKAVSGAVATLNFQLRPKNDSIVYLCVDFIYSTKRYDPRQLDPNAPIKEQPHVRVQWKKGRRTKLPFGKSLIVGNTDFTWKHVHLESAVSDYSAIIITTAVTPDRASVNIDNIRIRHGVWVPNTISSTAVQTSSSITLDRDSMKTTSQITQISLSLTPSPSLLYSISPEPSRTVVMSKEQFRHYSTDITVIAKSESLYGTNHASSCVDTVTMSICPSKTSSVFENTNIFHSSIKERYDVHRSTFAPTIHKTPENTYKTTPESMTAIQDKFVLKTKTTNIPSIRPTKAYFCQPVTVTEPITLIITSTDKPTTFTTTVAQCASTPVTDKLIRTSMTYDKTNALKSTLQLLPQSTSQTLTSLTSSRTSTTSTSPIPVKPFSSTTDDPKTSSDTQSFPKSSVTSKQNNNPNTDRILPPSHHKPTVAPPSTEGKADKGVFKKLWEIDESTKIILVACIGAIGWILFVVCLIFSFCGKFESSDQDRRTRHSNVVRPISVKALNKIRA